MNRSITYPSVEKSALDKKEYRGIQLPNKMKAMLVSDPLTDKSAAALCVVAGSMCDPGNLPGLAHFCEHMLFLGTKKYPAENEYSKFVSQNAGSSNAYTANDHTNFYFEVDPMALRPALDIFSQFFIAPLFTESAMEREVNAVHSEHEKNITSDYWRTRQVDLSNTDPNHPYCHFGTGNRETLWEIPQCLNVDVRKALIDYHNKYYSANLMSLCVLGTESLDELQEMVEEMFSEVENRDVKAPRWPQSPYTDDVLGTRIDIVSVKDLRLLTIEFPIPDIKILYKANGDTYLALLIGHEGPGSLLSLLKNKNWVTNLSAGTNFPARGFGLFYITVDLTTEGIQNIDEITVHIFQYLKMLSGLGPQKWVWEELRDIKFMRFRFQDKKRPESLVTHVANAMHEIPVHEVLSAGFILTDYDTEFIQNLLGLLNADNCRISVLARAFADKADQREEWYNVKYSVQDIDENLIMRWKNCCNHPGLTLPAKNEFIPSNFKLKEREPYTGIIPTMTDINGFQRLWFLQDNEFNMPKAFIRMEIFSHLPMLDPLYANLNYLFASCVVDQLTEYAYAAKVAGIDYTIVDTVYGLEVTIAGYDHKLPILLKKIIDRVLNFQPAAKRFEVLKESYTRELKNFENEQPFKQVDYYSDYLMRENRWSNAELLQALEGTTLESLVSFSKEFVTRTKLEWAACGNLSYQETKDLVSEVGNMFKEKNSQIVLPAQSKRIREINLEQGQNYVYQKVHPTHFSSCVGVLFQTGLQNKRENVLLELIENICQEPCFNQLRTVEQLGYIVYTNVRQSSGTQGMTIVVQSDKHPAFLESRIDDFLQNIESLLKNLSEKEFLVLRRSLYVQKSEKPKKLRSRAKLIWNEISSQQYEFDRQNVELKELESVTLQETIQFFEKYIALGSETKKKLSIYVISKTKWIDTERNVEKPDSFLRPIYPQEKILNVDEWKNTQGLYPIGKPLNFYLSNIDVDFQLYSS